MNVLFRVDASKQIGWGHLVRCLSLAEELSCRGARVSFVSRRLPIHLFHQMVSAGYTIHRVEEQLPIEQDDWSFVRHTYIKDADITLSSAKQDAADWVVADHYALDAKWEGMIRTQGYRLMVMDDLADRSHECEILLDQNLYQEPLKRYKDKVSHSCQYLFGPSFALLRPQFREMRSRTKPRIRNVERILISFGGSDVTNESAKALQGLSKLVMENHLSIDVILGPLCPNVDDVKRMAEQIATATVHTNVQNIADFMARADVSFGGGGTTTWERCCLGLPSFVTLVADNQSASVRELVKGGVVHCLGCSENVSVEEYGRTLESATPDQLAQMSRRGMQLVDGLGCMRVADCLFEKMVELHG